MAKKRALVIHDQFSAQSYIGTIEKCVNKSGKAILSEKIALWVFFLAFPIGLFAALYNLTSKNIGWTTCIPLGSFGILLYLIVLVLVRNDNWQRVRDVRIAEFAVNRLRNLERQYTMKDVSEEFWKEFCVECDNIVADCLQKLDKHKQSDLAVLETVRGFIQKKEVSHSTKSGPDESSGDQSDQ